MPTKILIVGGWSFNSFDLDPLIKAVPKGSDVTVLTSPDLAFPEGQPAASLQERFAASVQEHAFDLAIGWSMGGMLILDAILRGRLDTRNLLLFSSCARFLQADEYPDGVQPKLQQATIRLLKKDPNQCIRDFRNISADPNQTSNTLSTWKPDELNEGLNFLSAFDVRSRLSEITQPTLIIHGKKDRIIKARCASGLNSGLPNSNLVFVPEVGHDLCIRNNFSQVEWIQQALHPATV
jgi:pimeloyl-[acyl-carrier protein] methyl ester esterase